MHRFSRRITLSAVWAAAAVALVAPVRAEEPAEPAAPAIEIKNARMPLAGVLSGGQVTEEQLAEAAQLGYRTIINLRTAAEPLEWDEPARVEELGMRYVSIPIAGIEDVNRENAEHLAEVLDQAERPILLHCGSGNRVGALFALNARFRDGKDSETALQVGIDAGLTRLEPTVREILGLPPAPAEPPAPTAPPPH